MIAPDLPQLLLCGVSGGADSVALLRILLDAGREVTAVHVNHGLRGEASDGDEQFVRELCARWRVPLLTYRAVPPENPGEGWARTVRYGFFRQAMEETGAQAIALAHHRDDQAETLLLHLLRGSGLTGLTGMQPDCVVEGVRVVRPLLGYARQALRDMLTAIGQPWREDASNADPRYLRNALRHEALPLLERLAPGASARLAHTAQVLTADEAVLRTMAADFLAAHAVADALPLAPMQLQMEGMRRRILRAWWKAIGPAAEECSLSGLQTDALSALISAPAGTACNLPGGWRGYAGWTHLHLVPPENASPMPETAAAVSGLIERCPYDGFHGDGRTCQALPGGWLDSLTIRTRRTGDWLRPFGCKGRQSLQDYFTNRRVDAPFRDRVPLLCRGSEVLLAGGVGAGDIPKVEQNDEPVLLRWTMSFPWHRE